MGPSESVVRGAWYDHAGGGWRWLCTDFLAVLIVQFLGVWLTLSLPRLVKLILHIMDIAARYNDALPIQGRWAGLRPGGYNTRITIEHETWQMGLESLHAVRAILPGHVRLANSPHPLINRASQAKRAATLAACSALLFVVWAGFIAGGVAVAYLQLDNLALARAKDCGAYTPDANGDLDRIQQITTPYEFQVQSDSANYAGNCYGKKRTSKDCNMFVEPELPYSKLEDTDCPFANGMCYLGSHGAIAFSTPAIPARSVGINTDGRYEIMRETTYVPLNMNDTFITLHREESKYTFSYRYGLARSEDGSTPNDITWQTVTHGDFSEKLPSYSAGAFVWYKADWGGKVSDPISQIMPPDGSILSLILILPGKIYYTKQSDDPIFPTNSTPTMLPNTTTPYYMYKEGFARPLAAIDTIKWRNLDDGPEWRSWKDMPPFEGRDGKLPGALWLLWFSIQNSFTYQAMSRRLASSLDASSRLSGLTSLPLDKEQWKTEAENFFKTSLAMIQFEARNIALGVYASYPGYVKQNYTFALCDQTYVFPAQGWTNVSGTLYLVLLVPFTLVIISAIPYNDAPEALVWELLWCGHADWAAFWIVRAFAAGLSALRGLAVWSWSGVKWLGRLTRQLCQGFLNWVRLWI